MPFTKIYIYVTRTQGFTGFLQLLLTGKNFDDFGFVLTVDIGSDPRPILGLPADTVLWEIAKPDITGILDYIDAQMKLGERLLAYNINDFDNIKSGIVSRLIRKAIEDDDHGIEIPTVLDPSTIYAICSFFFREIP